MHKLHVNLISDPRAGHWLRWVALAAGLVLAADAGRSVYEASESLTRAEQRVALLARDAPPAPPQAKDPEALEKEIVAAQGVIKRLSLPWNALFSELEKAQMENVSLLSVEPDAESRALVLAGEAKDYYAVLGYVATLKESKRLSEVYLARHELRRNEPMKPVAFSVNANWKNIQ